MDIKWEDGAVCFADGAQIRVKANSFSAMERLTGGGTWRPEIRHINTLVKMDDFQLNEVRQGDYIEASELDTEQKYNDAVEVFGLFGFENGVNGLSYAEHLNYEYDAIFIDTAGEIDSVTGKAACAEHCKRKITYPQLMAIGKLKRAMIERDAGMDSSDFKSSAIGVSNKWSDAVNKPSHYQFFEGVEVIEIIASSMTCEQFKGYCLGNRIKYRLRAGNKDKLEQEIAKSDKYVELYDEHKHLCKK